MSSLAVLASIPGLVTGAFLLWLGWLYIWRPDVIPFPKTYYRVVRRGGFQDWLHRGVAGMVFGGLGAFTLLATLNLL